MTSTDPVLSPIAQVGVVGAFCILLGFVVRHLWNEFRALQRTVAKERETNAAKEVAREAEHRAAILALETKHAAELVARDTEHGKILDAKKLEGEVKHRELVEATNARLGEILKATRDESAQQREHFADMLESVSAKYVAGNTDSIKTIDKLVDRIVPARGA